MHPLPPHTETEREREREREEQRERDRDQQTRELCERHTTGFILNTGAERKQQNKTFVMHN